VWGGPMTPLIAFAVAAVLVVAYLAWPLFRRSSPELAKNVARAPNEPSEPVTEIVAADEAITAKPPPPVPKPEPEPEEVEIVPTPVPEPVRASALPTPLPEAATEAPRQSSRPTPAPVAGSAPRPIATPIPIPSPAPTPIPIATPIATPTALAASPTPAPAPPPSPPADRAALEASDPQHRSARKLARLAVSEVKLYNEKLVTEGLAAGNLYARLQDPIDQARALFERRVPADVRASFDYVHDELVRQLAGGDASKLGPGYPGRRDG
jgi:hypothetical protein